MRFDITDAPIEGVKVVTRKPIGDERGWFERFFCLETLQDVGWSENGIVHVNHTFTAQKGTVRGMHYQKPPHAEYKFVSCLSGKIYDVALDLRKDSPTFLQHFGIELSQENHTSLLVPEGVAHGFQAMSEDTVILYLVSKAYNFDFEGIINPSDPKIGIEWPLPPENLSEKDQNQPFIDDAFEGLAV